LVWRLARDEWASAKTCGSPFAYSVAGDVPFMPFALQRAISEE
jgi:hypothetical protein